jgi:hypothetical protein
MYVQSELDYLRTENRELLASIPLINPSDTDVLAATVSNENEPIKLRLKALQHLLSRTVSDLTELSHSQQFNADYCQSLLDQIEIEREKRLKVTTILQYVHDVKPELLNPLQRTAQPTQPLNQQSTPQRPVRSQPQVQQLEDDTEEEQDQFYGEYDDDIDDEFESKVPVLKQLRPAHKKPTNAKPALNPAVNRPRSAIMMRSHEQSGIFDAKERPSSAFTLSSPMASAGPTESPPPRRIYDDDESGLEQQVSERSERELFGESNAVYEGVSSVAANLVPTSPMSHSSRMSWQQQQGLALTSVRSMPGGAAHALLTANRLERNEKSKVCLLRGNVYFCLIMFNSIAFGMSQQELPAILLEDPTEHSEAADKFFSSTSFISPLPAHMPSSIETCLASSTQQLLLLFNFYCASTQDQSAIGSFSFNSNSSTKFYITDTAFRLMSQHFHVLPELVSQKQVVAAITAGIKSSSSLSGTHHQTLSSRLSQVCDSFQLSHSKISFVTFIFLDGFFRLHRPCLVYTALQLIVRSVQNPRNCNCLIRISSGLWCICRAMRSPMRTSSTV